MSLYDLQAHYTACVRCVPCVRDTARAGTGEFCARSYEKVHPDFYNGEEKQAP